MPKMNINTKPTVVKIGKGPIGAGDTLYDDLVSLQRQGKKTVVVHGGGDIISRWQKLHGIEARFVRGLRYTDLPSLEVAVAVLAGLANKEIVAAIQGYGGRAVGLSGVDGGVLQAQQISPELGYVGRVTRAEVSPLNLLLEGGYIPVVAPIAYKSAASEDKGLLNVNADTAAAEIAVALGAAELFYMSDVPGVQNGAGNAVPSLSPAETKKLIEDGVITSGMIPKVEGCLRAAEASIKAHILDGRQPHALLEAVEGRGVGTRFG